ncbi:MAG: 50S ribosomal protein L10 [Gammaproteobacteria bacterium]|nr:50S ribosomal protein L10 [Gammaproteobacteria bacterium]
MALRLDDKKAIVAEVADIASRALSAVVADYRGLSVADLTRLRSQARKANVYVRVVRNTLARRAVVGTEFECMTSALTGSMILAFSKDEPGSAARLIRDFIKGNDKLQVKALAIGGKALDGTQLEAVAKLPTRNEAIANLMGMMQAPITQFVRTLAEPHTKMVRTIAAIRDQKQSAA